MRFRDHRWPCDYPAVLRMADGQMKTKVVNISASGARVRPVDWLGPGDNVGLEIAGVIHEAEVRWLRGDACGLRFTQPLELRMLATIRRTDLRHAAQLRSGAWNLHLQELR